MKRLSTQDFKWRPEDFRAIKWQKPNELLRIELKTTYCLFEKREHSSNHGYFLVSEFSVIFRCHNEHCKNKNDIRTTLGKGQLNFSGDRTSDSAIKFEDHEELNEIIQKFFYLSWERWRFSSYICNIVPRFLSYRAVGFEKIRIVSLQFLSSSMVNGGIFRISS